MQFFPLKASCSETAKQVTSCKHEVMMVELKIVRGHERGMGKLDLTKSRCTLMTHMMLVSGLLEAQ